MMILLEKQRRSWLQQGPPTLSQRRQALSRLREAVLLRRQALEDAVSTDFGYRSRHETALLELVGVVQAIDYLRRHLPAFMRPQRRQVALTYRSGHAWIEYQPKGVVGIMVPWNYPVSLALVPLATAVAAGNRVMLKPSEFTPQTNIVLQSLLADCYEEAEVAIVTGDADTGAAFSALPFDHLLFTGSTAVGHQVMRAAAGHLVPLTLELGGKSPVVVARGHVNARTLDSIVFGKLSNSGQTCVAPDYALVHQDDMAAFVRQYDASVRSAYPEGPAGKDCASIISEKHHQRLQGLLADARRHGAQIIESGLHPERAGQRERCMAPTLVIGADDGMAIMQQEIFGPILLVHPYRTMAEVIAHINARPRPLALYYFGTQDEACRQLLSRTTSGNVGINHTLLHVAQHDLPFGGIGPSGMGACHGIEGFRSMSHAKGIFKQGRWNLPALLRPPYGRLADTVLRHLLPRRRP